MERGVVVGGMLISISFLLAVMLNRSAMDAAPVQGVNAEADTPVVRGAAQSSVSKSPIAALPSVRATDATLESSQGNEVRRKDCPAKSAEQAATSQERSDNCST